MTSFANGLLQISEMDRMYRYARHFYDATRKYYLLGRDVLLDRIASSSAHHVLEIGCGTARNLIGLARRMPHVRLYGLDASALMLQTAGRAVYRKGQSRRIVLRHGLAENLDHFHTFGLTHTFDVIFFSYTLSMIPAWKQALDIALQNLNPGGQLFLIDFWDQAEWPAGFASLLRCWLEWFNVYPRPELLAYLQMLSSQNRIDLSITPHARRYAFIAQATNYRPAPVAIAAP